jgi:hypothetical protein
LFPCVGIVFSDGCCGRSYELVRHPIGPLSPAVPTCRLPDGAANQRPCGLPRSCLLRARDGQLLQPHAGRVRRTQADDGSAIWEPPVRRLPNHAPHGGRWAVDRKEPVAPGVCCAGPQLVLLLRLVVVAKRSERGQGLRL